MVSMKTISSTHLFYVNRAAYSRQEQPSVTYKRELELGYPTAHGKIYLWLLPSGPDQIHRFPLRRTQLSTLTFVRQTLHVQTSNRNSTPL